MFKIGIAMKFCGSTYQVMRQQWLERGLTPCPGRAPAGSRPALALAAIPNPCTRQGWVLGIPSQSCWTLGAQHPPSLSHMVLTLFQPHCSQELSAPGLLLLPSSHPPHPTNRCQQPLLMLLAGPKDSNTISAQLLLPHCKPPCSSTFLMASVHSHGYVKALLLPQRRKIPPNGVPSQLQGPVWKCKVRTWAPSRGWGEGSGTWPDSGTPVVVGGGGSSLHMDSLSPGNSAAGTELTWI